MPVTRGPSVKAAVTWAAAALHVLQAVDKVLGLHLVPQPVAGQGRARAGRGGVPARGREGTRSSCENWTVKKAER